MDGIIQGHMRFGQELHASGKMVVGERLRPDTDANRIRVKAGQRQIMDGPFTETKEAWAASTSSRRHQRGGRGVGEEDPARSKAASSTCGRSGRCERKRVRRRAGARPDQDRA